MISNRKAALALGRLADPRSRSGLIYFSLVDFVRGLEGRGFDGLEPLFEAVRGKQVDRAISVDWGVDSTRQAFSANVRLPLGNLLLFKSFLGTLGPGVGGADPGFLPMTP